MKFARISKDEKIYVGLIKDDKFIPFDNISKALPDNLIALIEQYEEYEELIIENIDNAKAMCNANEVKYLAPIDAPVSFRDFMGFKEHYENCLALSGRKPRNEYYDIPVFYFSNSNCMRGSDEVVEIQPSTNCFDFEFEIGFVIGKKGINIKEESAMDHIFGLTIINDWSSRDIQAKELLVGLGPAKGKDYATSVGPILVTIDEFEKNLCEDNLRFDLKTTLKLNHEIINESNTKYIHHSFSKMIERASKDVTLYPGELFGSGTIGGCSLLEYNREKYPYLKKNDVIEMSVEGIGILKNTVI